MFRNGILTNDFCELKYNLSLYISCLCSIVARIAEVLLNEFSFNNSAIEGMSHRGMFHDVMLAAPG